jgi:hypothetical protein
MKRTRLCIKRKESVNWKLFACSALFSLLFFALFVIAESKSQTVIKQEASDTYTKYFFTRDECRYIFPEGSCVVDDKYCDLNSYDYQVIELEPYSEYCHTGTIVYNAPEANHQPRIVPSKEGECDFTVNEGDTVRLKPEGYDPDPEIGPAGHLVWTFYKPFDKNGIWRTQKGDAGRTWSKVQLSDGELSDEREFCVDIVKSNSAPVLSDLQDIKAEEGEKITISPRCTDPDGDKVTIVISGFMTSGEKTLSYADEGRHKVTVTCSDPSGEKDVKDIFVTVSDANRPPVLEVPAQLNVDEGKTARIEAKASDPDGDKVEITYEKPFAEDGTWRTRKGDAGSYSIKVTASDGERQVTKTVVIVVTKTNSAPSISGMRDLTIYEGDKIVLRPRISDADNDKLEVKYTGWMTSDTKQTGYDDAGEYDVEITASDGTETVKEDIHITVLNKNRPPVITKLQ